MAYRPLEYVPEPYRPDDRRLSELMYLQGQNEINRLQQQGRNNQLMWAQLGRAGSGMLSDLAQYKREEPARKEAERLRKEKDKLRGLEQFAGAGNLSEEDRGKLLKQEGFVEKGQEILDKDMARKASKAVFEDAERKRRDDEMSRFTFDLDKVRESADPATTYAGIRDSLREKYKVTDLPDVYDKDAIDAYVKRIEQAKDINDRNARAEHSAKTLEGKRTTHANHVKAAVGMFAPLAPKANTLEEWDGMWSNFDARMKAGNFTDEEKAAIEAEIPYPRKFSQQAYQQARDLEERKDPTSPLGAAWTMFEERYGRRPSTPADEAEINRMVASMARSAHVATGRETKPKLTQAQLGVIDRWARTQYSNLEKRRELDPATYTDQRMDYEKELIQQSYLQQRGEEGSSLAEIATLKGEDISGRKLSDLAKGAAAVTGAAPAARTAPAGRAGKVLIIVPPGFPESGQQSYVTPAEAAQLEQEFGRSLVVGSSPAAPTAPPAPSAPSAPPPQQGGGRWIGEAYVPDTPPATAAAPPQQGPRPSPRSMLSGLAGGYSGGIPMYPTEQAAPPPRQSVPPPQPAPPVASPAHQLVQRFESAAPENRVGPVEPTRAARDLYMLTPDGKRIERIQYNRVNDNLDGGWKIVPDEMHPKPGPVTPTWLEQAAQAVQEELGRAAEGMRRDIRIPGRR